MYVWDQAESILNPSEPDAVLLNKFTYLFYL